MNQLLRIGMEQDDREAVKCYRKATEQGDADGQYELGVMYADGRGVAQDDKEAIKWYRKAVEQGHVGALIKLGIMYEDGRGVEQDNEEAALCYHKAAEQGHAEGQYNLGDMYANGLGIPKDDAEALKWYSKAAEQGHAKAKSKLDGIISRGVNDTKVDLALSRRRPNAVSTKEIKETIIKALSERPNNSCTIDSLTTLVLKELEIRTSGKPRLVFEKRVMSSLDNLAKREIVEKYRATNKRVRLLR